MPSLISDLDLPSPLSAFSVEIEDIFNFELEEILDTPEEKKEIDTEAAFRPIPLEGSHSDKCNIQTVEDTTIVTSTQSEVELQRKEELDNTPPTGSQAQNNSPHQEPQHNPGETQFIDNCKCPLSPSVTHHGPKQKNQKVNHPPTPIPRNKEQRTNAALK